MSTPVKRARTDPDSTGSPSVKHSHAGAGEDEPAFGETKNINVDGYGPNIQPMGPENHYPHNDTFNGKITFVAAPISDLDGRHYDEDKRKMPYRTAERDAEDRDKEESEETCCDGNRSGNRSGCGFTFRSSLHPILFQMTQRPVFRKLHNGLAELIARVNCNNNSDYFECCKIILRVLTSMMLNRDSDILWNFAKDLFDMQPKHVQDKCDNIPEACDNVDNYNSHFLNYNFIHKRRKNTLYRINSSSPM